MFTPRVRPTRVSVHTLDTAQRAEQDMTDPTDHLFPVSADQDLKFIYNFLVHSNSLIPTRVGYKYNQKRFKETIDRPG